MMFSNIIWIIFENLNRSPLLCDEPLAQPHPRHNGGDFAVRNCFWRQETIIPTNPYISNERGEWGSWSRVIRSSQRRWRAHPSGSNIFHFVKKEAKFSSGPAYPQTSTMSESETDFGLRRKKSQRREAVLVFYVIFCFPYNYNVLIHCPSCWKIEWLCAMPEVVQNLLFGSVSTQLQCTIHNVLVLITMSQLLGGGVAMCPASSGGNSCVPCQ